MLQLVDMAVMVLRDLLAGLTDALSHGFTLTGQLQPFYLFLAVLGSVLALATSYTLLGVRRLLFAALCLVILYFVV